MRGEEGWGVWQTKNKKKKKLQVNLEGTTFKAPEKRAKNILNLVLLRYKRKKRKKGFNKKNKKRRLSSS